MTANVSFSPGTCTIRTSDEHEKAVLRRCAGRDDMTMEISGIRYRVVSVTGDDENGEATATLQNKDKLN